MQKFFVGLIIAVLGVLGYEAAEMILFLTNAPSREIQKVTALIEPGPFFKTAEFLQKQGVITDARKFEWYARITRQASKVRVGEYALKTTMTPQQVLNVITSGKSILHVVTIQEGASAEEIRALLLEKELIDSKKFWKLLRDKEFISSLGLEVGFLEGYLFPNTYSFTRFTGEKAIIKTMVDQFKQVWEQDVARGAQSMHLTQRQVVTLASIIEKETGAQEERPFIASVFFNRLKLNMPLQSDPTVIYGKMGDRRNITKTDLRTDHPFNTYTRKGLPAGPISNPGRAALIATVEPAESKYLYFVSRNNGTHVFSENYENHLKAVKGFQLDPKARQGHSWRERLQKEKATKSPAAVSQ